MCTLVPYMNAFSLPDREKCPYKAKGERNRVPLLNPKLHSATTEQQKDYSHSIVPGGLEVIS